MKLTLFSAAVAIGLIPSFLNAQTAVAPAVAEPKIQLPSAESILQRYVEVTGGAAAYDAVKTESATGTFSIAAAGLTGSMKVYSALPAKSYAVVEIPNVGTIEEGTDGKVAWENSAIQGARIKTGDEAAAIIRQGAMDLRTNWKKYYKSVETAGTDLVDGKTCYKVVMTPQSGAPETAWFEKDSGLMVKQASVYDTPMGKVPMEILVGDYKKQGDLTLPFHMEQHLAGQQFDIKMEKFEFNTEIPDSRFAMPAEVKALQK